MLRPICSIRACCAHIGLWFVVVLHSAASAQPSELVPVDLETIFAPQNLDDNDSIVLVLDGTLPDPCHVSGPAIHQIDQSSNRIYVRQLAHRTAPPCPYQTHRFTSEIRIGTLPKGEYTVVANNGNLISEFSVHYAASSRADDYLFAPVNEISIQHQAGEPGEVFATLAGEWTSDCLIWNGIRAELRVRIITVYPGARWLARGTCSYILQPFRHSFQLPRLTEPGRYLLHVRSFEGRSVNRVFTVPPE